MFATMSIPLLAAGTGDSLVASVPACNRVAGRVSPNLRCRRLTVLSQTKDEQTPIRFERPPPELIAAINATRAEAHRILRSFMKDETEREDIEGSTATADEEKIVGAVHEHLEKSLNAQIGAPLMPHFFTSKKTGEKLRIPGAIYLGFASVALIVSRVRVTQMFIEEEVMAKEREFKDKGYTDTLMFVGGPRFAKGAKDFALKLGINVVQKSRKTYQVVTPKRVGQNVIETFAK